jgi:AcrR family transcriptional regulator
MTARSYHHGDLRRALLRETATVLAESDTGPAALSLRDLARRAGVSHAAPAHHFGDKAGLLTAFAAEGYDLLADALADAWKQHDDFIEVAVAYVRFAATHRQHFDVMFRPDLYHRDDPDLVAAERRSAEQLYAGLARLGAAPPQSTAAADPRATAAWSLVHGFATLLLAGNLPQAEDDPESAFRAAATTFVRPGRS